MGCYQKVLPTMGVGLPSSNKATRTVLLSSPDANRTFLVLWDGGTGSPIPVDCLKLLGWQIPT